MSRPTPTHPPSPSVPGPPKPPPPRPTKATGLFLVVGAVAIAIAESLSGRTA